MFYISSDFLVENPREETADPHIQLHDSQDNSLPPKLPLKTKASAFCGAPTAMTPAAAATAPVSMARARLSGAGTKAMLFRRQATAAKTHTAARRAMVRAGKGRGRRKAACSFQKQLRRAKNNLSNPWKLSRNLQVWVFYCLLTTAPGHVQFDFFRATTGSLTPSPSFQAEVAQSSSRLALVRSLGRSSGNHHVEYWKMVGKKHCI